MATGVDESEGPKLWGGRFSGDTDPLMHKYNQSLSYDQRMWREDIDGSHVYAESLAAAGIISSAELETIASGWRAVATEWDSGTFEE